MTVADPHLRKIMVIILLPDDVIRERAKKSGEVSNRPQILEQRIKDYHREMGAI